MLIGAGDYCLDGARPVEVLEILTQRKARLIRGNTDRYIAGDEQLDSFEPAEAERIAWSRERLGEKWLALLRELPAELRVDGGLLVVHANPLSDDEHVWPDADDALLERFFGATSEEIVAFGHLHLPYVRLWRGKLLVNVASCGIPKDGDLRASYGLLTKRNGGWEVKLRRVEFDRGKVVRQLKKSGMPHVGEVIETFERARYGKLKDGFIP